ncbi:hypothetical protein C8R48DRAFT_603874 [Suillus tomentosus]|nr:hypothetical protein C8R48DRAFT_603874 [Suillus tomentosus]
MVENSFSLPHAQKPEHMFYDSNCSALKEVDARGITFFKTMGMCVDVFHLQTKHKDSDEFCCTHCDAEAYPELRAPDGKWFFNTSAAEQANAWLGGYHSMCREMVPVKFKFFLNKMINMRNAAVVKKLEKAGRHPCHSPHQY